MSLLDTTSLLLTPNAYKEGKLYSVIPSDGSGDFTFTRATTATRVNSDGLVELVPYNLLQRSQEFENGVWSQVRSTVTANTTTAPDETLTADSLIATATSGSHYVVQGFTALTNTFTISVYAKANGYNGFRINTGTSTNGYASFDLSNVVNGGGGTYYISSTMEDVGNGWYRCVVTFGYQAGAQALIAIENVFQNTNFTGDGTSGIYLWGAQLVEGTDALPYQKTETRLNIPRIDYSLGGCPNILLEPQRTNLALYSSSFDNAYWIKTPLGGTALTTIVTPNVAISPSGIMDADLVVMDLNGGTTATDRARISSSSISITNATAYTTSIWVKAKDVTQVGKKIRITQLNVTSAIDIELPSDWTRILLNGTSSSTLTNIIIETRGGFGLANKPEFFLWGAQVEAGSYATSYIPTTTASVTRNADVCTKTNASAYIGQTEGSVLYDFNLTKLSQGKSFWAIDNGSTAEYITLVRASSNVFRLNVKNALGAVATLITSPVINAPICKIGLAYKNGDYAMYINGDLVGTSTNTTNYPTTTLTQFVLANATYGVADDSVNLVALWKERLTNDQLAQLTTL